MVIANQMLMSSSVRKTMKPQYRHRLIAQREIKQQCLRNHPPTYIACEIGAASHFTIRMVPTMGLLNRGETQVAPRTNTPPTSTKCFKFVRVPGTFQDSSSATQTLLMPSRSILQAQLPFQLIIVHREFGVMSAIRSGVQRTVADAPASYLQPTSASSSLRLLPMLETRSWS